MIALRPPFVILSAFVTLLASFQPAFAQPVPADQETETRARLTELNRAVDTLQQTKADESPLADVRVFAKAVDWALRHDEFYQRGSKPTVYGKYALDALAIGLTRSEQLAAGSTPWRTAPGRTIVGYVSRIDGSVQPYALSVPEGVDPKSGTRWPLHVKLHGRGGTRNEIRFVNEHHGKPLPAGQDWIQIDVFGRTDNAYRFAGETDVFEAIKDVSRRFRIDEQRVTLWGFSMGGAGAWHLGLHHPSKWSSVGPGAGFVDFYDYQKQTERRPSHQHRTLHIYDALDYALNAFNVPVCTYGGEFDAQLVASTAMVDAAKKHDVPIKLLIGPGMGHKFHPEVYKDFMAFHVAKSQQGRKRYPGLREISFITYTPKYNTCEWLTVEELTTMYEPATVQGKVDPKTGVLRLKTQNVAAVQIARDIADFVELDGRELPLNSAAEGLLPGVYYVRSDDRWELLDYEDSRDFTENPRLHKRRNLQGPIDDAFMEPFVCVKGTGTPFSPAHQAWADWTLARFSRDFDKWLRGRIPVIDDKRLTKDDVQNRNLILFGDPGSNSVLADVIDRLPIEWTQTGLTVNGVTYDPSTHGVALIYPNPLNRRKYVVLNSGHTFHEKDFKASNSWLFPRLGDVAVRKFEKQPDGSHAESTVWAELFDSSWKLPK